MIGRTTPHLIPAMGPGCWGHRECVNTHPWMEPFPPEVRSCIPLHIGPWFVSSVFRRVFWCFPYSRQREFQCCHGKTDLCWPCGQWKTFWRHVQPVYICCISLLTQDHSFAYTSSRKSESAYKISIIDAGTLTPLGERWENLYNEVRFKYVNWRLCACESKTARVQLEDVQYTGQIPGHACSSRVLVLARGPVHCPLLPTLHTEQYGLACWWSLCLWRIARQPELLGCQRWTF